MDHWDDGLRPDLETAVAHRGGTARTLLVTGDASGCVAAELAPFQGNLSQVGFEQLTKAEFLRCAPSLVISTAWASGFDCLELARMLEAWGFMGRYRILQTGLGNPDMVLDEVRRAAPRLDIDLIRADRAEPWHHAATRLV